MDMTESTGLIYEIYNDNLRDMKMGKNDICILT